MTASAPSFSTMCAATATAFSPDEQNRLTVEPGTGDRQPGHHRDVAPDVEALRPLRESGAHDDVVDLLRVELRHLLQQRP